MGYFVYDLIACKYYDLFDMDLLIHHTISCVGLLVGPVTGLGASAAVTGIVISEVSNFPMHLRTILKNYGLKHTMLHDVLEGIYFFLYIIARSIFGPLLVYKSWVAPNSPKIQSILCACLCVQSYMFMVKMAKIIRAKFGNWQERKSKNVALFWFSENPRIKDLNYVKSKDKIKVF